MGFTEKELIAMEIALGDKTWDIRKECRESKTDPKNNSDFLLYMSALVKVQEMKWRKEKRLKQHKAQPTESGQ